MIFTSDMLTADFCIIKNQLEILAETTKSTEQFDVKKPTNAVHSLDTIKLAKTAYSLLYEISVELNGIVSLSQLINLTQGFIYLTSDLHTLYVKLYQNDFAALPGRVDCEHDREWKVNWKIVFFLLQKSV